MNRKIFSSTIFITNKTLSDRINHLFLALEQRLGFETIYADRLDERAAAADLVLIYAGVHGKELLLDSLKLGKHIKVVYLLTGPHSFAHMGLIEAVVARGSLVLCTEGDYVRRSFPRLKGRLRHFPYYFAPHYRYAPLRLDVVPEMKCLFTGHINPQIYPLRNFIMNQLQASKALQKVVVRARHPRYGLGGTPLQPYEIAPVLNETYALALNSHYCSVATGSKYRYVLAKYFEIPAAGALLLGERTPDSDAVGLKPGVHYVPIDRTNVVAKMNECVRHPERFEEIRVAGCEYVRAHHSVCNRAEQLEEMLLAQKAVIVLLTEDVEVHTNIEEE